LKVNKAPLLQAVLFFIEEVIAKLAFGTVYGVLKKFEPSCFINKTSHAYLTAFHIPVALGTSIRNPE
jgi:hypothetical protein